MDDLWTLKIPLCLSSLIRSLISMNAPPSACDSELVLA